MNLEQKIQQHLDLIKYTSASIKEAPERASAFLIMVAILADEKRSTEQDRAKLNTIVSGTFAKAMATAIGKGVTEKKLEAESNDEYSECREALEDCESKISWLRTYIEIFNNAHITYRNLSKEM